MEYKKTSLSCGLIYLFYYLAGSMIYSFLTLYFQDGLNFNGSQIGLLAAIGPLIGSLVIPLWGLLTDITRKPKLILCTVLFGSGLFLMALNIPSLAQNFGVALLLVIGFNACFRPITPLNDNFITSSIADTPINYSRVRAWGSLGFTFGGLIIGYIIDNTSISSFVYVPTILFILTSILVITFSTQSQKKDKLPTNSNKGKSKEILSQLVRNKRYITVVTIAALAIGSYASIISFNSIIITELGGDAKLAGILSFAASALEVPVMIFVGQKLIEKKGSAFTLRIAVGILLIRCIITYFINDPILFVIVTAANGITVALLSPTVVLYIRSVVDSTITASAFSFYISISNIGMAVGSLALGNILEFLPVKYVFFFGGFLALVSLLLTFRLDRLDTQYVSIDVKES